jgi:3-dehydroquinate dehydratase / shikimate dehydrogenase
MGAAKLCVTVTGDTTADLRRARDEVVDADLVELRLDSVRDPNVAGAMAGRRCPVIVTCRPRWEGGGFAGSEEERKAILSEALDRGAEYVDIEARAEFHDLVARTGGRRIVLSRHHFDAMPGDLLAQVRTMRSTGAEIVKIAVATSRLADCVTLLELGAQTGRDGNLVLIGMGEHGIATRVLASRFRSAWTYAGSLEPIGQLDVRTMVDVYRFRTLSETTDLYGLVGGGVSHSVSPAMHNAAFEALHLDAVYLPLPSPDSDDVMAFGRAVGLKGASVTIPHKVSLFDRVDEVYAVARRIGAINTIRVVDGRWVGSNTDAQGFLETLQGRVPLGGLRISILGAGGAARAVIVALASTGCEVTLHARRREQAEALAATTPVSIGPWPPARGSWDVLINCTPVGMYPDVGATPIPAEQLTGRYVYDLIYNPAETRLMREGTRAGCRTIGGLDMLVGQAQEQFHWWTGSRAPSSVMREAAARRLAEFTRNENYIV